MSEVDKLTGFASQKHFLKRLEEEILRSRRYQRNLSVLLAKVNFDYFDKSLNSQTNLLYPVLKHLSPVFRNVLRSVDLPARYEGDYLAAMLPETDERGAWIAAQRLCQEVRDHKFKEIENAPLRIALSVGIAVYPKHGKQAKELILSANKGLQVALAKGGNCFESCPVPVEEIQSE